MTTFVLIPGAGGDAWYWHRVVPELEKRGFEAIAVELPAADDNAGLAAYADTVIAAIGDRTDVVLVAQSMGGLTAPLVCERMPVRLLVLLNAMTPAPGETGGDWWANTDQHEAARAYAATKGLTVPEDFDLQYWFFHDVPAHVTAEAMSQDPEQSGTPFGDPWPLKAWPDVPTRFLQGADDRMFPLKFQRRVVRDRLGIEVDEMPGGHVLALSQPAELAERLVAYANTLPPATP